MSLIKRLSLALAPATVLLLAAACGDEPAPTRPDTPTPTPGPTATPTIEYFTTGQVTPVPTRPRPTATPTATPAPAAGEVYVLDRISTAGCRYELRMGETTAWGYGGPTDPDQRILAGVAPDDGRDYNHLGGIEVGPLNVGDTLQFRRFENPSRVCLETVSIVNEELGLNETLAPDERIEPFALTFTKAGRFVIDDPAKPGERGSFVFVVNEVAPAAEGIVYVLDRISTPDCNFELRMGETSAWGYNDPVADARINATEGDGILVTVNVGDKLEFRRFENPARICLETVSIFNEELGIDETLAPDERVVPYQIEFTKAGTFVIDDPAKPGGRGKFVFVVNE